MTMIARVDDHSQNLLHKSNLMQTETVWQKMQKGTALQKDSEDTVIGKAAEVFISSGKLKSQMDIEVVAEGFHRYDYNKATATPTSNDDKYIIEENAVPLDTLTPAIEIPMFNGEDENCEVKHAGADNKVEVEFTQGVTRENLTLATFTVSWKGMSQLDVGIYKAKVSVIYSTP